MASQQSCVPLGMRNPYALHAVYAQVQDFFACIHEVRHLPRAMQWRLALTLARRPAEGEDFLRQVRSRRA